MIILFKNIINFFEQSSECYFSKFWRFSKKFGLIINGIVPTYASYFRENIGYNTDESVVNENVQMSDVSENLLKYFHYAGSDEFSTTVNQPYLSKRCNYYDIWNSL